MLATGKVLRAAMARSKTTAGVVVIIVSASLGLIGCGSALLSQDLSNNADVTTLDPDVDFQKLPGLCTIEKVTQQKHDGRSCDSEGRCTDSCHVTVMSFFSHQGDWYASSEYDSRKDSKCDELPSYPVDDWKTGDEVPCWQPAAFPVPAPYKCGNPECYKVFSPREEVEILHASNGDLKSGLVPLGSGLLMLAGLFGCIQFQVYRANFSRDSALGSEGRGSGPDPDSVRDQQALHGSAEGAVSAEARV